MDNQLLVRMYNVGLGDCIYLKVPDGDNEVHILIDCGNKFSDLELLGQHIGELQEELPDAGGGKKRLDLLVVTHPHEDHHKGFEEEFFGDFKINRLWLSPAFDRWNPNAQGFQSLQDSAQRALESLSETELNNDLKEEVAELLSLTKSEAIEMLTTTLPEANGIKPLYVSADTPQDQLDIFNEPVNRLKVLAPMADIDAYYLGGDGLQISATGLDSQGLANEYAALFQALEKVDLQYPRNIGSQDFKLLRDRVNPYALAAAEIAGHVTNNLSVVLLLEWHGRRLLFPGDAEWKKAFMGQVKAGRSNGSWNVMWQERKDELSQPLDFLKIGHHGSENATPWTAKEHPINDILDALLPLPEAGQRPTAQAVVSTERTSRWPSIPDPNLMAELGKRVANARSEYIEDTSRIHVPAGVLQPTRTDLEKQVAGTPVPYIETRFSVSEEGGLKTVWSVPYPSLGEKFVGHRSDLDELVRMLNKQRKVGIIGIDGIGKTQLAIEYVYQNQKNYPHGVFWLNAVNSMRSALLILTNSIGIASLETAPKEALLKLRDYLKKNPQSILVFDNLENPSILDQQIYKGFIPSKLNCQILYTSRNKTSPDEFQTLEIKQLSPEESLQLLFQHRGIELDLMDPEYLDVKNNAEKFQGVPLALELAGAYFKKTDKPLEKYPKSLREITDLEIIFEKTLELLWEEIEESDAGEFFKRAGQLPPSTWIVPERLGLMCDFTYDSRFSISRLQDAFVELKELSLTKVLTGGRFQLHPLVYEFASGLGDAEITRLDMANKLMEALYKVDILEDMVKQRGSDAVIEDINEGLSLLPQGSQVQKTRQKLEELKRLLEKETYHLRQLVPASNPGFFLQQIAWDAHSLEIHDLAISAETRLQDNRYLYFKVLWSTKWDDPDLPRTYYRHNARVNAIALLQDRKKAISASEDGSLKVWNLENGDCLSTLKGHKSGVIAVELSGDGSKAISGSEDNDLRVWDLDSGDCLLVLEGHASKITAIASTRNGKRVVTASKDGSLRVWDLETGDCLSVLEGHSSEVTAVVLISDDQQAVSSSIDGTIRVWDLQTWKTLDTLIGHTTGICTLALSGDGRVVSGDINGELRVWDLTSGNEFTKLVGHQDKITVVVSAGNQRLVSSSIDSTIRIWDLDKEVPTSILRRLPAPVTVLKFTENEHRVISASDDSSMRIWDAENGRELAYLVLDNITTLSLAPDKQRIIAGDEQGNVDFMLLWELDVPNPPPELLAAVAAGECVIFAGDGLAAQSNLPGWHKIIKDLVDYASRTKELPEQDADRLRKNLERGDYKLVERLLVSQLPEAFIQEYIQSIYQNPEPSEAHQILSELPLMGGITTTFDTLLSQASNSEEAQVFLPEMSGELISALRDKNYFTINLNGAAGRIDKLPLTPRRIQEEWRQNQQFRDYMDTLLRTNTLFFVGMSLDFIIDILDSISLPTSRNQYRQHFVLAGEPDGLNESEVSLLKQDYNLTVIEFNPSEGYPELPGFLDQLKAGILKPKMEKSKEPLLIDRLALHNIGPFSDLELSLMPSWNILLGDNGMGKSVILRSIAAALSGHFVDENSVKRLLNTEASEGWIEVGAGKRSYRVEFGRDSNDTSQVLIKSSLSTLQRDKWLVLGFPALRAMTSKHPEGPTKAATLSSLPQPREDLLPILSSEPDMRLNNLKQWIVNLEFQSSGTGKEAEESARLKNKFFQIFDEMTPGLKIGSPIINRKTLEIKIETESEETIPLEFISQGTTSLMCWVGTLVERMSEIYKDEIDFTLENVLLLIDEIDAHMHPAWQWRLPDLVRKLFPNVQVVAATHSPLIIGGCEKEEIFQFSRDENDLSHILIQKPDFDPSHWRADQILTSSLFNLDSTYSPEIYNAVEVYTKLSAKDDLTSEEQEELEKYAAILRVRPPNPLEREQSRLAFEKLEASIDEQLEEMPLEKKKKIIEEAKVQIQENITGSRRPL